jgi:hypothetical protein
VLVARVTLPPHRRDTDLRLVHVLGLHACGVKHGLRVWVVARKGIDIERRSAVVGCRRGDERRGNIAETLSEKVFRRFDDG